MPVTRLTEKEPFLCVSPIRSLSCLNVFAILTFTSRNWVALGSTSGQGFVEVICPSCSLSVQAFWRQDE